MTDIDDELKMMKLVEHDTTFNRLLYFDAAPKQKLFYQYGIEKRERMFMAGNGVGKSESGAYEDALHLTGDYPDDWTGIRYQHPVTMWIACETSILTRDVMQTKLCGKFGVTSKFGTGFIPKDRFADKPTLARGVTDAFDTIQVVHKTNGRVDGISTASFKSFEQGREKFQGENLDFGHCDEESPMDVYSEFLARIRKSPLSRMIVTFTPLHGKTKLVRWFQEAHPDRVIVQMSLDEATWYTEEQKQQMLSGYPEHERDARRYGIPKQGEGAVFPFPPEMLKEAYIQDVPPHWYAIWGIDFGINHPFGACLMLWDKDEDVLHVRDAFKIESGKEMPWASMPLFHAARIKQLGANVPVAWPHDGHKRQMHEGEAEAVEDTKTLARLYKNAGLRMLPEHSTYEEGGYKLEPVVQEVSQRIMTGKFKVSSHLSDWFEEYMNYHREKGLIVPIRDDILSATWKAVMMKRKAVQTPLGTWTPRKNKTIHSYMDPDAQDRFFGI